MISSRSNPEFKQLYQLSNKSKERRSRFMFLVEGRRELERAYKSGFRLMKKYSCPDILIPTDPWYSSYQKFSAPEIELSRGLYNSIAVRKDVEGVIGLFETPEKQLPDIPFKKNPLILVLDQVEKPGNIGAILRTADGAGVDAVLLHGFRGDIFNPNTIRASLGCIFSVPVLQVNTKELSDFLIKNDFKVFATLPEADSSYFDFDYSQSTCMILGAEDKGISASLLRELKSVQPVNLPMKGIADSLNVSVSAALVSYEVLRQRKAAN